MKRHANVPKHFVSLQVSGYRCENYYIGAGGKKIGLTVEVLESVGLVDDTLWVHPDVLPGLETASRKILEHGFHILIKDAWRPSKLYDHIVKRHKAIGSKVGSLINGETKAHATGLAIDAVLLCATTGQPIMTRNQLRDGVHCCFVDFYRGRTDAESLEFQRRQDVLVNSFLASGFKLGAKKEYWHFEHSALDTAPRF